MGLIETLDGRRTYLDANVFIYVLEGHERFGPALRPLLRAIGDGMLAVVTSELTLAETLVGPLRQGLTAQAQTYHRYLTSRPGFDVQPVTRAVLVEAARLRAATSLKLPDVIHAATALQHGCAVFLTNDNRIKAVPSLDVLRLADFA